MSRAAQRVLRVGAGADECDVVARDVDAIAVFEALDVGADRFHVAGGIRARREREIRFTRVDTGANIGVRTGFTPTARMRTSTCEGPGAGVGTFSSFITSGLPNSRTTMARMGRMLSWAIEKLLIAHC